MSRLKITALVFAGCAVVVSASALWWYANTLNQPVSLDGDVFLVEKGESWSSIVHRLESSGAISQSLALKLHARLRNQATEIKAGEYIVPRGISQRELFQRLVAGEGQVGIRLTILEGWTFREMREAVSRAEKLRHTTTHWTDAQIMAALGHPDLHPEGRFFPDTYYYRRNDRDLEIYRAAFHLMQEKLADAWENRAADLEIENPYQALIMASIIEKETQVRDEQGMVSSVFNNRLKKGMRLQTDPTVIYGIGADFKGNITRKHLKTDTPYNTYTRHGFPPTPICLPGHESLLAAVNPASTDYLYFVAMGQGRHKFSRTLAEHNAAVNKYIRKRSN